MAVTSALRADDTAIVRIHVAGAVPPAITSMAELPGVEVHRLDPPQLFAGLPQHLAGCQQVFDRLPAHAASARSNLLRYALLYLHGGVYIDFDVIVLRPLHDLSPAPCFVGLERVWTGDEPRVAGRWTDLVRLRHGAWALSWTMRRLDSKLLGGAAGASLRLGRFDRRWSALQANNAIIGAVARSEFVDVLLRRAMYAPHGVRYALGPTLVHHAAVAAPHLVETLAPEVLYQVPPGESFRFFEDRTLRLHHQAAAVHYVGSNHGALLHGLSLDDPRFRHRPELFWRLGRQVTSFRPQEVPA